MNRHSKTRYEWRPPIFLFANCDRVLRVICHAALTLFTMAIPLTPLVSKTTNQNRLMTESTEQEPTRSCAILKKAREGQYVLAAVVHVCRDCKFHDAICRACGKIGYLAKVCRSSQGDLPFQRTVGALGRHVPQKTCGCHLRPRRMMSHKKNRFQLE
ncbi:UNVERIFIED_CONTAM: hypothetical protein K2H54_022722 [Gekko kuhli]